MDHSHAANSSDGNFQWFRHVRVFSDRQVKMNAQCTPPGGVRRLGGLLRLIGGKDPILINQETYPRCSDETIIFGTAGLCDLTRYPDRLVRPLDVLVSIRSYNSVNFRSQGFSPCWRRP